MRVKRWVIVLFGGVVLTSLATAMGLAWLYRNYTVPGQFSQVVYYATLQFIDHPYRELLVIIPGGAFIVWGILQLSRSITAPLMESRANEGGLAKIIETHRLGERDPKLNIVTIGGGTGLSTLLRGIKHEPVRITAIVTAGDDGGSSGRLRTEFNVPAPGDIRNCLVALADSETLLGDLFQYRFDSEDSGLDGHSFGNLFITALTKVSGSFEQAIIESGRVLNIRGAVYPSSLENIVVGAEMADGSVLRGETTIVNARERINRVFLDPSSAEAYLPAVKAILEADLVVLGPGSLYTSVIPNLLVEGIAHALRHTPAETVYVCNVATQPGETDHYDVADHVRGIHRHLGDLPIDRIIVNSNLEPSEAGIKPEWGVSAVEFSGLDEFESRLVVEPRDVVNPDFPLRHDPQKLAKVLVELAQRTTIGPPRQRQYRDMSPTGQALNGHAVSVTPNGHTKHIETTP
ncbi:MAG: uridine diphosphate-N-acetylglucosamine-binding protein YvcK [Thermomicrobiales bacterium]